MTELYSETIHSLSRQLKDGTTSSVEITQSCLDRAEKTSDYGAWLTLDTEGALAQAKESDKRRASEQNIGPFDGIPVALKDNFLSEGLPTRAASKILETFVSPYDGTAVRKLKEAGSVILGKANMDEFAMGSSNEHSAYEIAKNPWNKEYVPGGSSGGSAVSVALGSAIGALGTDTGGSIRQPAAYSGIVGIKPTYGRVSRYGVIAFASSLDQVGPMNKDVTDAALMLQTIAGHDPKDSTSADVEVPDYLENIEKGVSGLRLGVPKEYYIDGLDPEVRTSIDNALELYKSLGAELVELSLPNTEYAIATYYLIATAEASSNLARYDGIRYGNRKDPDTGLKDLYLQTRGEGFGPEVKRHIMLGTYALSSGYYDAYYLRAQKARTLIRMGFDNAFQKVDAIITPTTPKPAFKIGEKLNDPIQMYLEDIFTVSCNLGGLAGMSLPAGMSTKGLPIGMQILTAPFQEATMLQVARAFERETEWHQKRAEI